MLSRSTLVLKSAFNGKSCFMAEEKKEKAEVNQFTSHHPDQSTNMTSIQPPPSYGQAIQVQPGWLVSRTPPSPRRRSTDSNRDQAEASTDRILKVIWCAIIIALAMTIGYCIFPLSQGSKALRCVNIQTHKVRLKLKTKLCTNLVNFYYPLEKG